MTSAITYTKTFTDQYDQPIRELYKKVNDLMKVHPVFTQDVLNNKLQNPSAISGDNSIWIAIDSSSNGKVVGIMCLEKMDNDTNELSTLSILPEYRRKKIGSTLLKMARQDKKIHLTCFGANKAALNFYNTTDYSSTKEEHRHSQRTNVDYTLVHFNYNKITEA